MELVSILALVGLRVLAVSLPPMPVSPYADTEVSTNVAFNAIRNDARHFGVSMDFSGTASNCVQIAFGRDADSDGDLSPCETRLVLGWRGGAYFIEDASGQNRISEPAVEDAADAPLPRRHFGFSPVCRKDFHKQIVEPCVAFDYRLDGFRKSRFFVFLSHFLVLSLYAGPEGKKRVCTNRAAMCDCR